MDSKALSYLDEKGWSYKVSGDQANIEDCPFCGKKWHMYMHVGGERDGLFDCKACGNKGNLYQLKQHEGDQTLGISSTKPHMSEPMPKLEPLQHNLLDDEDALDYLIVTRQFSVDVIEQYQLGLEKGFDGRRWLVIPYLHKGKPTFIKYRTLPPEDKAFRATKGEVPLFNEDAITKDITDLVMVEGESDCLSCLSKGITNVVGVPGANTQKTLWIQKIDNSNLKKVFILFDRDDTGQNAARELAAKIGIEKSYNILLPSFKTLDGKDGKDINEWFCAGNTFEQFEILKQQARPFDVEGVVSVHSAIDELIDDIENKGSLKPTLDTPWPKLTERMGGVEYTDVVGILAPGKVGKTTLALDWLEYYTAKTGINTLMLCLEMPPKRLIRKWVSHVTQTNDTPGQSLITKAVLQSAKAIASNREAELLFGYLPKPTKESVFNLIRQAVRRYGVKVVAFDNLQFLARSLTHQVQEIGIIMKMFKDIAMELGIAILLIIQPRMLEKGSFATALSGNGSSAIDKDVDAMVVCNRKRIAGDLREGDVFEGFETTETFEPLMNLDVGLCRYGPGGCCQVFMDGATSTVRDLNAEEINAVPRQSFGLEIPLEAA